MLNLNYHSVHTEWRMEKDDKLPLLSLYCYSASCLPFSAPLSLPSPVLPSAATQTRRETQTNRRRYGPPACRWRCSSSCRLIRALPPTPDTTRYVVHCAQRCHRRRWELCWPKVKRSIATSRTSNMNGIFKADTLLSFSLSLCQCYCCSYGPAPRSRGRNISRTRPSAIV